MRTYILSDGTKINMKEYKCIVCGTKTINNQASGPLCQRCWDERMGYERYGFTGTVESGKKNKVY
jgi:DNA-directed RNA polymerase subunit RPC12/RpoP